MKKLKLLNFEGQTIYVVIDVHLKSWKITIRTEEFELKTFNQSPDVKGLAKHLFTNYPGARFKCVYEAGFSGFWLQRELTKAGIECIVVHPADIPTMDKEKKQKSDAIDSRKLSRSLKNNEIAGIYIPSVEIQEAKSLLRSRVKIVTDLVRVKNRLKFFLMQYIKELGRSSFFKKNVDLLLKIPSIGINTAMTFLSEIGEIKRFRSLDQLCCYFGLIPTTHSSGEKDNVGRNTRRGNKYLKHKIIECAWVAIRKDPGLLMYYKNQVNRMESNKAIIKVARKLLNRIKLVLTENIEYQLGLA